jgi:LmbE family N-acetylglucosaminyl deacetylase
MPIFTESDMAILGQPATYRCDNPACGKLADGWTRERPKGWILRRWKPGVLLNHSTPDHPPPDRHYCCRQCADACKSETADFKFNKELENG